MYAIMIEENDGYAVIIDTLTGCQAIYPSLVHARGAKNKMDCSETLIIARIDVLE